MADDAAARFKKANDNAVVDNLNLDNMGRVIECGLSRLEISRFHGKKAVVRQLIPYTRRPRRVGRGDVGDCGQDLVVYCDGIGRLTRGRHAGRDHQRQCIPDMTGLFKR